MDVRLAAALILPLAGCLEPASPQGSLIALTVPLSYTFGYAYDGTGVDLHSPTHDRDGIWSGEMHLHVRLDVERDSGIVWQIIHGADSCDGIRWDTFRGAAPYQQGGIARDVILHGASGQDGPQFPQVRAKVAAWGTATVFANSAMLSGLPEPISQWSAHLMWLDGGIRDEIIIRNSTSGIYDPSRPGDGPVKSGDDEFHLELRNRGPDGAGFEIGRFRHQADISSTASSREYRIRNPDSGPGNATVEVELRPGTSSVATRLRIEAYHANDLLAAEEFTSSRTTGALRFPVSASDQYRLVAYGSGVGASYVLEGHIHVPELVLSGWGTPIPVDVTQTTSTAKVWIPDEQTCGPGVFRGK